MMVQPTRMARPLLALSGRMATECATWQAVSWSGHHQRCTAAFALSATAAGATSHTSVLFRGGVSTTHTTRASALGFGCVVDLLGLGAVMWFGYFDDTQYKYAHHRLRRKR